ncbi:MAG: hypothetical protein PHU34_09210 [Candidatus Methanoperedens sp.]|nr:hypothetical protein [Candidatus Methanoperedens sp.]
MYLDNKKIIPGTLILAAVIFILANPASAGVEISDFFSDFTSSDVIVNSTQDFHGKAVFELFYAGSPVESQEVTLNVRAGDPVYKVITWQKKPQHDYYTAKVSIYNDSKLLTSSSYEVSYGTSSLPGFHVVDFSPSNSGVQLLLRPFNPSAVDIKIELLDNNDVVYTKLKEDVSLKTLPEEIKTTWPFLLTDNKNYIVRLKIFTHRLYAPALVNTYIAKFTAASDVEILADDVQVDEYGASVTVRGKSQVPFDGFIVVTARSRATNETQVYRTQMEEILVSGKEDTAGVVWKGLAPGTYDVEILAVNKDNVTIDKYETALRIPEYSNVSKSVPAKTTSGFEAFIFIITLLLFSRRLNGA